MSLAIAGTWRIVFALLCFFIYCLAEMADSNGRIEFMFLLHGVVGHPETDYTDYGERTTWESGPNSADLFGVQFHAAYEGKPMKYCIITCIPINAVGDAVACTVTDAVEARFKVTGPVESGGHTWTFEDGWYNPTIESVKIMKVDIQYMDGSTEKIAGEKLAKDLRRTMENQQRQKQIELEKQQFMQRILEGKEREPRYQYQYALVLLYHGEHKKARKVFEALGNFKESQSFANKCKKIATWDRLLGIGLCCEILIPFLGIFLFSKVLIDIFPWVAVPSGVVYVIGAIKLRGAAKESAATEYKLMEDLGLFYKV